MTIAAIKAAEQIQQNMVGYSTSNNVLKIQSLKHKHLTLCITLNYSTDSGVDRMHRMVPQVFH